jgi:hypothetical protein
LLFQLTCRSVIGKGTILQAEKSRVLFTVTSLDSQPQMALGSTHPLTEMNTRIFLRSKARQAHKANNLTAICVPVIYKMLEPRRLRAIWTSTARYTDSFAFYYDSKEIIVRHIDLLVFHV